MAYLKTYIGVDMLVIEAEAKKLYESYWPHNNWNEASQGQKRFYRRYVIGLHGKES